MPKETAYAMLDAIQNNPVVKAIFYDNSQVFFLLKYIDITLLSQLLLGIAFIVSKKVPKWAIVLYFVTLLLIVLGVFIDPYYGRIIKRFSYAMLSISFSPIIAGIVKSKYSRETADSNLY